MATVGDLVLIHFEEQPAFFARLEEISADRKPDWYEVRLLILQIPLTEVVWLLREEYINGGSFTMQGHGIRIEKVEVASSRGANEDPPADTEGRHGAPPGAGNVISIFDRKRG